MIYAIYDQNDAQYRVAPCPYCGGEPMVNDCGPEYQGVLCPDCGAHTDGDESLTNCYHTNEMLITAIVKWQTGEIEKGDRV